MFKGSGFRVGAERVAGIMVLESLYYYGIGHLI